MTSSTVQPCTHTLHGLHPHRRMSQRGASLFIVLITTLLSTLLVLWSSRTAVFNELFVSNEVDYQRTLAAAESLLKDAQFDIRGQRYDGQKCIPNTSVLSVCRQGSILKFPSTLGSEWTELEMTLHTVPDTRCKDAICWVREGSQDFWNDPRLFQQMQTAGARYGQYTGAVPATQGNPLLQRDARAWYWVEVIPYAQDTGLITEQNLHHVNYRLQPGLIYRITAVALGLKPGTRVVLQTVYALPKRRS